jgi:2-polyprenyl-6-methoxyphenol hydroxylase-like FAD-dependent oxidoreductase
MTGSQAPLVRVQGSGVVGMALALSLARIGLRIEWIATAPYGPAAAATAAAQNPVDVRTYALNSRSVDLLRELRVWDAMPAHSLTAVRDMRIAGDRSGSQLVFSAWQQCVSELAWIADAAELEAALRRAMSFAPSVVVASGEGSPAVRPALVVHAEGKHSAARRALGAGWTRHEYGQTALAARLRADRPHDHTAWQWFRSPDVLALLPFDRPQPGCSFGLVWSLPEAMAQHLLHADAAEFEQRLNEACGGAAGHLALASPRAAWPLAIAHAERWCGPGWVLAGDAAHVVHPLAGQGLNLGLGDVIELTRVLAAREPWRDLGDERLLRRYERARRVPTQAMAGVTDGLLHLFASGAPLLPELRNRGLNLVNHLGSVKRWLAGRALNG